MYKRKRHNKTYIVTRRDLFDHIYPIVLTVLCIIFLINWNIASAQDLTNEVTDQELAEIATAFEPETENLKAPSPDEPRALIRPQREATISSLISARIETIHVKDGQGFMTGDLLVSFECDVAAARRDAAHARLAQYQAVYDANLVLRQSNAVSKLDFALSEGKVSEGRAEVALTKAQLDKCKVFAPYKGRVVKIIANEHESTRIGGPLLAILDDENLEVTLHAPSKKVTALNIGQQFTLSVEETESDYQALITAVMPVIDPASKTVEITAEIVGDHPELLAGMSGNAKFKDTE